MYTLETIYTHYYWHKKSYPHRLK